MKNAYHLLIRITPFIILLFTSTLVRAQTVTIAAPTVYVQNSRIPIVQNNSLVVPLTITVSRNATYEGIVEVFSQANGRKDILFTDDTKYFNWTNNSLQFNISANITDAMIDNFNATSYITAQFTRNGGSAVTNRIEIVRALPIENNTIGNSQTISPGATPQQLTAQAVISGGMLKKDNSFPTFKYQWQSSTTNSDASFTNIAGATNASYQPEALTQTTYFRRLAGAPLNKSNVVTISVDPCLNRPTGANFDKPFEIGTLNNCTNYSQSLPGHGVFNRAIDCFGNEVGEASDDIFYRFTLISSANVRIRHCTETWKNNILLYNANRTQIAASPYNKYCEELPGEVYEINTNLSAGTYYFALEGFGTNTGQFYPAILVGGPNCRVAVEGSEIEEKIATIEMYPNPVTEFFTINTPQTEAVKTVIQLFDSKGNFVKEVFTKNTETEISVNDLTAGLYLVRVQQGQTVTSKKIQVIK